MTLWTAADALGQQRHTLLACFILAFGLLFSEVQFTTFRHVAAANQVRTKDKRAGFNTRKRANLEPDPSYAFCIVSYGPLSDQLQYPLAGGYFVCIASY